MNESKEFTIQQEERIDEVYERTAEFIRFLTGEEEIPSFLVSELADDMADIITRAGLRVYFPTRTTDSDGNEEICDFY